ncbi:zinc finger protein 569-like [Chrysoperla carnea]|uniref:zinc finger protein 569-like n=1 Tax=Chrysoperla carnea TaxID=189513 RepID=UPI001D08D3A2|nr:zinc finger protein 569-like [Chrysoperla carnea]
MDMCPIDDFDKVCRICMKFDKTFLSITSFQIIDMIITCASVQIWENDSLPNQICHACFLQLQNTINFKQLCENSDNTFRQIIQQNKITLSNNVKDEEFEDFVNDDSIINIKEEDIHESNTNENTLENLKIKIDNEENLIATPELNRLQIRAKPEEENDTYEEIKDKNMTETFTCEECNHDFKKVWKLGQHMYREHKAKALKCNKCEIKCYHPLHLKEHQELMHNPLNHRCDICNKVLANIYKLRLHKLRHDKSSKDKQELKSPNKDVNSQKEMYVPCHICGKSVTKKNLKKHLRIHEERNKITCDLCSKTFLRQQSLKDHVKLVHENQKPARNHLCNICGYAGRTLAKLRTHLITHSTERPFPCDRCDKTYRSAESLRHHVSHVHLNHRKFQCTFCPQAFHVRKVLMNHVRRHTGEKPHKCQVCGKAFIQKIALTIHTKTHTNSSENLSQN